MTKLYFLFNQGEFKKAFSGKDGFFIKDSTWGTHNTQLVFLHLFKWLEDGNKTEENINKLKNAFNEIVNTDFSIDKISNGLWSFQLLVDYCIEADSANFWPLDKKFISTLLTKVPINENDWDKYNLTKDMNRVKKKLGIHSV